MQKKLLVYTWVCVALSTLLLLLLAYTVYLLLQPQTPEAGLLGNTRLVWEVMRHASI